MNVLVTGSAGYIGSHATARLLREGHTVVGVDNLFRGHQAAMDLCAGMAKGSARLIFQVGDAGDRALLTGLMKTHKIEGVMHFAALAYVGESVTEPLAYYRHNIAATVGLLEACRDARVERLVFSSSCSTYGEPPEGFMPVAEHCPQNPMSPYGRTKLQCEHMIEDYAEGERRSGRPFGWRALRYFNVAGCDPECVLGEDHTPETHLVPLVLQVAQGKRESITVFGTDYPTDDGTCVRDYIHVADLADAHAKVMASIVPSVDAEPPMARPAFNLGNGRGYSVREIVQAAERVTGRPIKVVNGPRRPGDPPRVFADPSKIRRALGWSASITDLNEIIATSWAWMRKYPSGYPKP